MNITPQRSDNFNINIAAISAVKCLTFPALSLNCFHTKWTETCEQTNYSEICLQLV